MWSSADSVEAKRREARGYEGGGALKRRCVEKAAI